MDEKEQEYLNLRAEIQTNLETQRTLSTFAVTAVLTTLGIGFTIENTSPELYLVPYIILFLASAKVRKIRSEIADIASYMIVRHENYDGFFWETCYNVMRRKKAENKTHDSTEKADKRWKNVLFGKIDRIADVLETQEFTFMALVCLFFFTYGTIAEGIADIPIYLLVERLALEIIGILCVLLIYRWSNDYWKVDNEKVQEDQIVWKEIIESQKQEGYNNHIRKNRKPYGSSKKKK